MAVRTSEAARYPDSMAPAKEIFIVFLFFVKWAHEIDKGETLNGELKM